MPSAPSAQHSPALRNLVHAGAFILFAPPLGWLADPRNHIPHGRSYAAGFMLAVMLFNLLILPRLAVGKQIARPGEKFVNGKWLYPLALAVCFLIYPLFAALGAWAVMAGGDAAANFAGWLLPRPRLPWNSRKSWAGSLAFVAVAFAFAYVTLYWCPSPQFLKSDGSPELPFVWTLAVLAAVGGAILESWDTSIDDNLRIPLGTGAVLWLAASFLSYSTRTLPADTHVQPEQFVKALLVNTVFGLCVVAVRIASAPGAALGVGFGTVIYFFAQWQGNLLMMIFVIAGSLCTHAGWKKKEQLVVAEAASGKRGVRNVAANLLVPVLCCLAYPLTGGHPALLIAFAGSIAAACADTVSSEIGVLSSKRPVLITSLQEVPPGTNGAISTLGLFAATLGSLAIAAAAIADGFIALALHHGTTPSPFSLGLLGGFIFIGGIAGTLFDSLLGATIEGRWPGVGKGTVNFACTLAGALTAGGLSALWVWLN